MIERLKQWEKQLENLLASFYMRLGAKEAPENWRGEWRPHKKEPQPATHNSVASQDSR